jgi:serine/threonine-protein kinase
MALKPGDIIEGKYRIVRLLGEGGMGAVYAGENIRIRHKVAIKVLHAGIATNKDVVARFEREAQAAGHIGSEHIVEVLDLGDLGDGERFMVMEFLEGESLAQRLEKSRRIAPQDLFRIALQLFTGLRDAHAAGIIHRDLKPDNVFLLRQRGGVRDFVKIVDFGISKFQVDAHSSATRTGSVLGTPAYMSPEQARGSRGIDHRTDLYAAGVILYECLTGSLPFDGETANEVLFKVVLEEPKPIEELAPDLDPTMVAIVKKAMARDPEQRYQSATEVQQALLEWAGAAGVAPANLTLSGIDGIVTSGASASVLQSRAHFTPAGSLAAPEQPPAADGRVSVQVTPATPAITAVSPHGPTLGSWATSGGDAPIAPKRRRGLVLGLLGATAAISLLAAGAWIFTHRTTLSVEPTPADTATSVASAPEKAETLAPPAPPPKAQPAKPAIEPALPEATASTSAVPSASTAPAAPGKAASSKAGRGHKSASGARPPTEPPKEVQAGRKIYTEL